jgi:hypothetical protein
VFAQKLIYILRGRPYSSPKYDANILNKKHKYLAIKIGASSCLNIFINDCFYTPPPSPKAPSRPIKLIGCVCFNVLLDNFSASMTLPAYQVLCIASSKNQKKNLNLKIIIA